MTDITIFDATPFTEELSREITRHFGDPQQAARETGIAVCKIEDYLAGKYPPSAPTLGILLCKSTSHRAKVVLDAVADLDRIGDKDV